MWIELSEKVHLSNFLDLPLCLFVTFDELYLNYYQMVI